MSRITDRAKLVDTANAYVNERACGRGVKDSGLKRQEIFISAKLWPSEYENPNAVEEQLVQFAGWRPEFEKE